MITKKYLLNTFICLLFFCMHERALLADEPSAVIRLNQTTFEIKDNGRAVETVKFIVTVLNKNGKHYGNLVLFYDKFREIEELEGVLYDVNMKKIRKLEDNDITDHSATSNYSLYEDSRVRRAELYNDIYPYTIEFNYEISYNGYINWPSWYAQETFEPVEKSIFNVSVPGDYNLRYWCNKDGVIPEIKNDGSKKIYHWQADNLPKLSRETAGEDIEDVTTIVYIAPTNFEIDEKAGNMNSWKDFGSWYYNLYSGKNNLLEKTKNDVRSLVGPDDDVYSKIKKLYRYLQKNTRYVSVQLGIGGWEPFNAEYVGEHGYGDCKALSNFMISLLKEVSINAYPVIIRNGYYRYPFIKEFPNNRFNHVIVCAPLEKDSVWLECTNPYSPFGSIGVSNENRSALMITPEGGVVVRTPTSSFDKNLQIRKSTAIIDPAGNLEINTKIIWTGNQENSKRNSLCEYSPEEKERWAMRSMDVSNINLKSYSISGLDSTENNVSMEAKFLVMKYSSVSGNRIFFQPNILEKYSYIPPDIEKRLSPIRFSYPYHDIDTTLISIPPGFDIEFMPQEVNLSSSFGNYSSRILEDGNGKLIYMRSLEINKYSVPAENYTEYRNFFSGIVKADKAQIVLTKKKY